MTTTVRTLLAVLALVAGTLTLSAAPSTAAAPPHSGSCHSISEGFKSWVGFQTTAVDCSVAHDLGKKWAGSCGRSSSTVTPMTCNLEVQVGSFVLPFHCSNKKGAQQPAHYIVHCGHDHHRATVSFTFFAHGF